MFNPITYRKGDFWPGPSPPNLVTFSFYLLDTFNQLTRGVAAVVFELRRLENRIYDFLLFCLKTMEIQRGGGYNFVMFSGIKHDLFQLLLESGG